MKTYEQRIRMIREKMNQRKKKEQQHFSVKTAKWVTVGVVVAAILMVLLWPYSTTPPSVAKYAGSEYYDLIQKINEATYTKPRYKNNLESVMGFLGGVVREGVKGDLMDAPNAAPPTTPVSDYVEVTDNQVQGVIEGDLLKRSTTHLFYLAGATLRVYSIAGEESELVNSFKVSGFWPEDKDSNYDEFSEFHDSQMYLSKDCSTITMVVDAYNMRVGSCTIVINLDVSDPANIREIGRIFVTGNYNSSRMVDGDLLLMNDFRIRANGVDFSKEETYLPQVGVIGDMKSVAAEDILSPEELTSTRYTVICKMDGKTLEVKDTAAFLSYSDTIYVSAETIYATRTFAEKREVEGNLFQSVTMTEITGVSYGGDTLDAVGSVAVDGSIKNQYAMDEYEGILRVVTSTAVAEMKQYQDGEFAMTGNATKRNVNLYCIDLENWSVAAMVEAFAPDGEAAESVRFDGNAAYVCTAIVVELTDPVYFFDLSDLENITWKDTGTIDGYSSSLIQLGDGYLLGIGHGNSWNLKIEIYEETKNGVESVCVYERDCSFSEDYKSYLIDREKDMVGLMVADWRNSRNVYILLQFDGYELREVICRQFAGNTSTTRGVIIDGYLYLIGHDFAVEKLS